MAENTAKTTDTENNKSEDVKSDTPKPLTPEQIAERIAALPEEMRKAITALNEQIAEHNAKVDAVKAAESNDPKLIKAEIFEQNPNNNKKLAALYTEYDKAMAAAEKIRAQAYEVIEKDGLMPKDMTEEERNKAKDEITASTKALRDSKSAFEQFEKMMPGMSFVPLISDIKTRGRGVAKGGNKASGQDGVKRPRFKRIEINGVVKDDKGNTVYGTAPNGDEKYTFTLAAKYLSKQHKGLSVGSNDLMDAMIKSGVDPENIPDDYTFTYPYTFKNEEGHETTVNYSIHTVR
jgi:hypothetical protein